MNYFDYIIIAILAIGFVLGFKDGLVRKIIGLLGIVAGVFLAANYSGLIGGIISPLFNDEIYLAEIIAGFLIFITAIFLASLIKRIVHPQDKVNRFMNQFLGGVTGTVQILFFLSGVLLFLDIFNFPAVKHKKESLFYEGVYSIVPATIDFVIGADEESKQFIKKYIEAKDTASLLQDRDSTINMEVNHDRKDSTR